MTNHARIRRLQKQAGELAQDRGRTAESILIHWQGLENLEGEIEKAKLSPLWGKRKYIWLPVKLQEDKGVE